MNPKLKTFLVNFAKNAVNASLTALGPVALWQSQFSVHNRGGLKHILFVMGSAAIAREIMVYGPRVLKWSTTNGQAQ